MALFLKSLIKSFSRNQQATTADTLSFDGLNPLLAKQLSELESQIGQLVQIQFELNQERRQMRSEMDNLKQSILIAAQVNPPELNAPAAPSSPNETL